MAQYQIRPILVGKNTANKAIFTYMVDMTTDLVVPVFIYYLEGGPKKILIDTGVLDPGPCAQYNGVSISQAGPQAVKAGLAELNITPEEIDIVILTHLHFDHAANPHLFPQAEFIVQKTEIEYANNPIPIQKGDYIPDISQLINQYNLTIVDGDFLVAPGISVAHTPGHTQGFQSVVVDTAQGKYVVAGDLIYMNLNLFPETSKIVDAEGNKVLCSPIKGQDIYPPGNHTSLIDWYRSVEKLIALTGDKKHLIPGHCPSIIGKTFP